MLMKRSNRNQGQSADEENQHTRHQHFNLTVGSGEFTPYEDAPQGTYHGCPLPDPIADRRAHLGIALRSGRREICDEPHGPDDTAEDPEAMALQTSMEILADLDGRSLDRQVHKHQIENESRKEHAER